MDVEVIIPLPGSDYQFYIQAREDGGDKWFWVVYDLIENGTDGDDPHLELYLWRSGDMNIWRSELIRGPDFDSSKFTLFPGPEMVTPGFPE